MKYKGHDNNKVKCEGQYNSNIKHERKKKGKLRTQNI
jgi:hypothetical protein